MRTIFYTANLQGDLDLLPRLYTFLRRLRGSTDAVFIDLGSTCQPDVWHCRVTEGRSVLVGLDGMGYTAANVTDLSPESRIRLDHDLTALALVDAPHPYVHNDLLFAVEPREGDGHLCVVLAPAAQTRLDGYVLHLATVEAGQVGEVQVGSAGVPVLQRAEIYTVPLDTPPDPTIAGVVDLIVSEARYYERRRGL